MPEGTNDTFGPDPGTGMAGSWIPWMPASQPWTPLAALPATTDAM